jgi:hypothetical protein
VGINTLEVRSASTVLGTATVTARSNVTGVTWTSPSTTSSGTVKFGETVTFTVAGENLMADPLMGFAVEKCGVSNTEVGPGTATARVFRCLFNNEAGAVAGQMPGVVKDKRDGTGQVLLDGWKVPVQVPVQAAAGRLPHSGIKTSQCYAAGSNTLVSCAGAAALALNIQQDGMRANVNTLSYSLVSGPSGATYDRTECVKDNVTNLIWEGKPATGLRAGSAEYTNYGDGRVGDSSTYVAAVNAQTLCGYSDWRLPTPDELQGLVDYSVAYPGPNIASDWFPNTTQYPYWTSTAASIVGIPNATWYVNFFDGYVFVNYRYLSLNVRLVRGNQ